MRINNPEALSWKYPLEGISTRGGIITSLPDEIKNITQAEINAIEIEYENATGHINKRQAEYPNIQEQLDMQYWDSVNGTTVWKDMITGVKAKYPKGVE